MAEYIDREAALEICDKEYKERLRMHDYCGDTVAWNIGGAIKELPCADVAPVVHGRWIHDGYRINGGIDWCHCSECGKSDNFCARTNYCPNCGAKMDIKDGGDNDAVD